MADADEPALITLSAHRLRNRRSQRWYQEGRLEEVIILIQLLFKRRFGTPSSELAQQIAAMPLEKGEAWSWRLWISPRWPILRIGCEGPGFLLNRTDQTRRSPKDDLTTLGETLGALLKAELARVGQAAAPIWVVTIADSKQSVA